MRNVQRKGLVCIVCCVVLMVMTALAGCSPGKQQNPSAPSDKTPAEQGNKDEPKASVDYPTKPIELVLPVKAGGDTDVNGRIFAKYLSKGLGQPVVVINMGGAGGSIGAKEVLNSPADGYKAMWYHNSTILNNLTGVTDINYTDFKVASVPLIDETAILVARTDSGWKDLSDMIKYAKENPNKVRVGMETATLAHLVPVMVEQKMDVDFNIVDIGAGAARLSGLIGGQIDMFFVQYGLVKDYIEAGEFVALCALSDERNPLYPDIPTAKELECDLTFDKFFYFAFPKDTPDEIVQRFNEAVEAAVAEPDLQTAFEKLYLFPEYHDTSASLEVIKGVEDFYSQYTDLLK